MSEKNKRALRRMARGADNLLPIVVYRKNGEASLDAPEPEDVLVHPKGMKNLEITLTNTTECGCTSKPTDVRFDGGQIIVELSGELTNKLGKGVYRLDLTYDEPNSHYADGMRHIALSKEACNVVDPKDATEPMAAEIRLEVQDMLKGEKGDTGLSAYDWAVEQGLCSTPEQFVEVFRGVTGLSAYELYLATTTDSPKMSLPEWQASNKGEKGDSAYQIYLNTTDDEHKLTEKQWANANDFFYQFLFRLIKGAGAKPTETDMTVDQVYELDRLRREILSALKQKGVEVNETDGIDVVPQAVRSITIPRIEIVKVWQFYEWKNAILPPMRLSDTYNSADLTSLFANSAIEEFPDIEGIGRAKSIRRMCQGCRALKSIALPDMEELSDMGETFGDCSSLLSITAGALPKTTTFIALAYNCSALKSIKMGAVLNPVSIKQMAYGCSSLIDVTFGGGEVVVSDTISAFERCVNLRQVNGVLNFTDINYEGGTFGDCPSLEEVRVKGIKCDIWLAACKSLSLDSIRYLVDNAQNVTGKVITLSSTLLEKHEDELTEIGETATQKGWTINYR